MGKIRIVHTIPMGAGGISNLTLTINERIDRNRFEFDYLVFRNKKEFCELRAEKLGSPKLIVDVSNIRNPIIKSIKKILGTAKLLKNENIEIIHIDASTPYDVILAVAAKMAGVKHIIFHAHNDNYERSLTLRNIMQPLFRLLIPITITDYIAISEQAAKFMFPNKITSNHEYYLIKNGIPVDNFIFNKKIRDDYRAKYELEDKFVVGNIGRFVYQKNHKFLIDVFCELLEIKNNALLILIGTGNLEDEIKNYVSSKKIKEKVIFWGNTEDVPNLLQMMDLFIFPSHFEGLGMAAIEAQASGLPTICSDVLPNEINITDNLLKLNLNLSPREWAERSYEFYLESERRNNSDAVTVAGYNLDETVLKLEQLYSQMHN